MTTAAELLQMADKLDFATVSDIQEYGLLVRDVSKALRDYATRLARAALAIETEDQANRLRVIADWLEGDTMGLPNHIRHATFLRTLAAATTSGHEGKG